MTRIVTAETLVTSPGRNFVTLRLTTEDGVSGLGDATLNGRELAVASYLRDHVAPLLHGRDARNIEDTWQFLYRGAYWRGGPVTMAAIGAVDTALWDIKARMAGMPLYQLLGGASRRGALAYGHATGLDTSELMDSIRGFLEDGYQAVRVQVGLPGEPTTYGVAGSDAVTGGGRTYEPARRAASGGHAQPPKETWDVGPYLRNLPAVFEKLRHEFGPELPLLHDAHHRLTPNQAARLGRDLEPYDLFWLEDPTPTEDQTVMRRVREQTVTPLAVGEVLTSLYDYTTLLSERLIDYVRSSVTHGGGVTAMRRLLDFAATYGVKSGLHGPTDVSPVGMAAALHLDMAVHNFGIQEYMRHPSEAGEVFHTSFTFSEGLLHPSDAPGLGVELDDRAAAAFPYEPAYLPVNRLTDGTLHDW